jgi:hypothetical protein
VIAGTTTTREFNVVTTNYTAEYGRTAGAVINAITKSGTNGLHGSAYLFDRDKIFDARNFFDPSVIPPFRRLQFGASADAPIIKDKTFIFGDFEAIRQGQSGSIHRRYFLMRQGQDRCVQRPTEPVPHTN